MARENQKMLSAYINEEIFKKLDTYCKNKGRTKKWVIENAIKSFLNEQENKIVNNKK
jgi:predicted DNA-binding protein